MSKRRVVITGLGLVSPVGNDVSTAWESIKAGKSGIGPIDTFDVSQFPVRFGGLVRNFDVSAYIRPKEAKKMDPFIHYGIAAGVQAIRDAGLEVTEENAERIGVHMGAGIGGIDTISRQHQILMETGPRRISPFFVPSAIINMISGNLSIMYGMKGPNLSMVTACATGTHAIGDAARLIQYGDADVMIAGGAEQAANALGLAGFAAARALSTRNEDPQGASRPWDRDRDGFVLADGAGAVVLEEYEHARARGARIYAEVLGFGMSGDAYHMTLPAKGGEGAARCMHNALRDAGLNPEQIDYINAHGTSTPAGDVAETEAIKRTFGEHAHQLAVSSTKSMTGHALGAAGALETIFTTLALYEGVLPPTINLENPDPLCDLDYVPNEARQQSIHYALNNSFGFGGTNGTLVLGRI